jgi:stearoyl-CoA desaturase (delta-9 desaturase)
VFQPITMKNWWKHLNLLNIYLIIGIPLMGLYGAWYTPLQKWTLIWSIVYYFNTGLGITAGMWMHWRVCDDWARPVLAE